MSENTTRLLQAIGITLQMINAAIGTSIDLAPEWSVIVSAVIGGYQYYIQHTGNQLVPKSGSSGKLELENSSGGSK